jgi:hypothetical protein
MKIALTDKFQDIEDEVEKTINKNTNGRGPFHKDIPTYYHLCCLKEGNDYKGIYLIYRRDGVMSEGVGDAYLATFVSEPNPLTKLVGQKTAVIVGLPDNAHSDGTVTQINSIDDAVASLESVFSAIAQNNPHLARYVPHKK